MELQSTSQDVAIRKNTSTGTDIQADLQTQAIAHKRHKCRRAAAAQTPEHALTESLLMTKSEHFGVAHHCYVY